MEPADVTYLLVCTIPDLAGKVWETHRLGRETTEDAQRNRPRTVKVELTYSVKARLWPRRRDLKHGESLIYINNDLSVDKRVNRKAALRWVRCSLPVIKYCKIEYELIQTSWRKHYGNRDAQDSQEHHQAHVCPKQNLPLRTSTSEALKKN